MKVFLSTDMEGTAGVVDWQQCVGDGPEAQAGRKLLLAEVNAAIEGAKAGGATQIVVNDSHSTMRNLPADELAVRDEVPVPGLREPARCRPSTCLPFTTQNEAWLPPSAGCLLAARTG